MHKTSGEHRITLHPHGGVTNTSGADRWVTIKEGHLKGRRILLDSKGYIVGGSVPRSFQGHHIGKLKGIGSEENPYSQYGHHELKEIHRDFSTAHEEAKSELHSMIHGMADQLKEAHEEKYGSPSSVANRVKQIGGIRPPKRGKDAFATEYHESIPVNIRRVVGNTNGLPLDEAANELGMTASELMDSLASTQNKGRLSANHFHSEAERALDHIHGADEMRSRRESIAMLTQEIAKLKAAMNRLGREGVKRIISKSRSSRGYNLSDRYAYKTNEQDPIYFPVNRIKTLYQTEDALNEDKVTSNMDAIQEGKALAPIVVGYKYDLHDGHHRLEAAIRVGHTHVPCVVGGRNERRVKAAEKRYRKVWKSMALVLDGKLLIKKKSDNQKTKVNFSKPSSGLSHALKARVASGDAHWVTIKEGPLEGRHLLIGGPRPAPGEKSKGEILAGRGIPKELIYKLTGATHAHHLEHEVNEREAPPEDTKERVDWWNKKHKTGDFTAQEVRDHFNWATSHKPELHQVYRDFLDNHPDYKRKRKATKEDIAGKSVDRHIEKLAYAASHSFAYNPWGGDDAKEEAIRGVVNRLTDEDIKNHWGEVRDKQDAHKKAITNPETLEELRTKKRELGEDKLTNAERDRLDELEALDAKKRNAPAEIKRVSETSANVGGFDVERSKHTKTGSDIWIAKPKNRVSKEEYQELASKMKQLGGYYSRFARGFVFDEDPGDKLNGLLDGGAEVANHKASEEYQTSHAQKTADKLREVADNMQSSIDNKRADRLTNTARRANMAAGAEADADRMEHVQKTMHNLANAIESGEATHLDGLSTRTQVETLDRILGRQKWYNDRKSGVDWESSKGRKVTSDDIRHVEYPKPHANVDMLNGIINGLRGTPGTKRAGDYLSKLVDDAKRKEQWSFDFEHGSRTFDEVQKLINIAKTNPNLKYEAERLNDGLMESKRLQSMGIESSAQLRSALREFMQHRGGGVNDDEQKRRKLRDLESQVTRQNIDGFFPTPKGIAHRMVEAADIKPGM